ncbi:hypothetical protein APV28_2164 [Comamonas testosteroni]|nr:hypothetical protein APV28_2164 [Comamonas testosteroni]
MPWTSRFVTLQAGANETPAHGCGGRTTHGWPGFAHAD